jgi:DNA polymerase III sliding clamp (beta) subunit (PCNA family)
MAVAMDSYGMAAVRTPMAATTQVVIPARSLGIAGKLPATAEGYQFASNSHRATIASGAWRLTTTLLEGTLPEWKHLFADPSEPRITSPKVELAAALHRVRGLAKRAELRTVVIRPDPAGDGIVLRVSVPDVGDQTARAAGTCDLEAIGLNFERITHAIDNLPTDEVRIEVVAEKGYAVIRDDDYIAVIPPVRGAR